MALTNGCVCCAIADDLGAALLAQVRRDPPPDRIVVEASGVADPARVMRLAGNWPGCRPAGTVVLADAATVRARAADKFVGALVVQQMRAADLLAAQQARPAAGPKRPRRCGNGCRRRPARPTSSRPASAKSVRRGLFGHRRDAGPRQRRPAKPKRGKTPDTACSRSSGGRRAKSILPRWSACAPAGRTSIAPRAFSPPARDGGGSTGAAAGSPCPEHRPGRRNWSWSARSTPWAGEHCSGRWTPVRERRIAPPDPPARTRR